MCADRGLSLAAGEHAGNPDVDQPFGMTWRATQAKPQARERIPACRATGNDRQQVGG
jgi:hypothetical protein